MSPPTLYQPAIPPAVRTAVYVLGLVVGVLSILAMGLAGIFWTDVAPQVVAAAGVAGTATGFLASALGVVYRPTAGGQAPTLDLPYTAGDDA